MKTRANRIQYFASRLRPLAVWEFRTFKDGYTYAICPRCRISMEREYVHYCNNCGQKLNWRHFEDWKKASP